MLTITRRRWEGIVLRDTQTKSIRELEFRGRRKYTAHFSYRTNNIIKPLTSILHGNLNLSGLIIELEPKGRGDISFSIEAPSHITIIRTELLENRRRLENGCFPYW